LEQEPVLNVVVQTQSERGLLGIDVLRDMKNVFLYFTESITDGSIKNRIYKYDLDGKQQLTNATLILDLPGQPGPNHDGGKLLIGSTGPEKYLYAVIGDLNHDGKLQNIKNGPEPDDTSVIVRISPQDGNASKDNPFGTDDSVISKYFAYGVRNSFGLAIDPVTGILWDTENGAGEYDEINIVKPGFNSGWQVVMGPIAREAKTESDLVMFPGSHYKDPLLSWTNPPALTAIEFLNSSKFGDGYTNNLFVGDYNGGNLYFFTLNEQRDDINLESFGNALSDKVVDSQEEQSAITFGTGFGSITDIKTGPDGLLYVLSYGDGRIYRLSPG
jgi:glucose/arabinose dehydrogenase